MSHLQHLNHKLPWRSLADAYGMNDTGHRYRVGCRNPKQFVYFARAMETCLNDFGATDCMPRPRIVESDIERPWVVSDRWPLPYLSHQLEIQLFQEQPLGLVGTRQALTDALTRCYNHIGFGPQYTTECCLDLFFFFNLWLADGTGRAHADFRRNCAGFISRTFYSHVSIPESMLPLVEPLFFNSDRELNLPFRLKPLDEIDPTVICRVNQSLFRRLYRHNAICTAIQRPDLKVTSPSYYLCPYWYRVRYRYEPLDSVFERTSWAGTALLCLSGISRHAKQGVIDAVARELAKEPPTDLNPLRHRNVNELFTGLLKFRFVQIRTKRVLTRRARRIAQKCLPPGSITLGSSR